jgi:MoaA/NifB/PqqE/SkfB family radical SAM enzyme
MMREEKQAEVKKNSENHTKVNFVWDIHYRCNFRCPFCWFDGKWEELAEKNRYPSMVEILDVWKRIYDIYGQCHIMITGGEPSIYPDFVELVSQLSELHTLKVTSQLSGDMYAFARRVNPSRVVLDMNFHPMETLLEPFLKKVLFLKEQGFSGGVCYLAYPPQMDRIDYYREKFEENGIDFALAAFWGEYKGMEYPGAYSEAERELIAPYLGEPDRIKYHLEGRRTSGKLCRAGYLYASVKADGTVTRCGPLSNKPIGNIFDRDFRLLPASRPCEADVCPCDEYVWLEESEK